MSIRRSELIDGFCVLGHEGGLSDGRNLADRDLPSRVIEKGLDVAEG